MSTKHVPHTHMHAHMHAYVLIQTHTGTHTVYTHVRTYLHTRAHTCTRTHTYIHAQTHTFTVLFQVTVEDHVKVLEAFRPDVAQCLCDTIPASNDDVTIKRVRKSMDRTLKFLDETLLAAEKSKV